MKTFDTDSTYDIFTSSGQIATASGKKAAAVVVDSAIRTILGEVRLDTSLGMPYFETVFSSPRLVPLWKSAVMKRLRMMDFVESVDSFDVDVDFQKNTLRYALSLSTTEGNVAISREMSA